LPFYDVSVKRLATLSRRKAKKPEKAAKEPITHKDYSLVRFLALYLINFRAPLLVSTLVNLFKFQ